MHSFEINMCFITSMISFSFYWILIDRCLLSSYIQVCSFEINMCFITSMISFSFYWILIDRYFPYALYSFRTCARPPLVLITYYTFYLYYYCSFICYCIILLWICMYLHIDYMVELWYYHLYGLKSYLSHLGCLSPI